MKRIRTINEALNEIKNLDPNTAVTRFFIKKLCDEGHVKSFKIGIKRLVDLDDLMQYIAGLTEGFA